MNSYLVQRGQFKEVKFDEINGMDSIINFDYMGSAEFEFGALPKSLKKIMLAWNGYQCFSIPMKDSNGKSIKLKNKLAVMKVYCLPQKFEEIQETIKEFISKKYHHTKEMVGMYEALYDSDRWTPNFWWDIENDWFAFFGNENRVKQAITKNIERNVPAIK